MPNADTWLVVSFVLATDCNGGEIFYLIPEPVFSWWRWTSIPSVGKSYHIVLEALSKENVVHRRQRLVLPVLARSAVRCDVGYGGSVVCLWRWWQLSYSHVEERWNGVIKIIVLLWTIAVTNIIWFCTFSFLVSYLCYYVHFVIDLCHYRKMHWLFKCFGSFLLPSYLGFTVKEPYNGCCSWLWFLCKCHATLTYVTRGFCGFCRLCRCRPSLLSTETRSAMLWQLFCGTMHLLNL